MLHAAQSHARGLDDVGLRDAELREMRGAAEVEFVRLIEERRHHVGLKHFGAAEDLDAVGALLRDVLHEFAGLLRHRIPARLETRGNVDLLQLAVGHGGA